MLLSRRLLGTIAESRNQVRSGTLGALVQTRVIVGGCASGIEIQESPKHRGIDPAKFKDAKRLQIETDPYGRGSKWLASISFDQQVRMIQDVLEANGVQYGDPNQKYIDGPYPDAIGVSNGRFVHSIEVRFYGRCAHGYPREP